jgi:adenylate cyclase class 2
MNGQEIEAKFYVLDLKKFEARLQFLDARLIKPRILERNIRYDLPDNSLRNEDRVLRLRQDDQVRLTFKGPSFKVKGALKRPEIELVVDDFDKARQFLEALGYQKLIFYEKFRITYELDKTLIMLDELPFGNFIEIEGQEVDAIRKVTKRLDLKWEAAIAASYHALFERFCQVRSMDIHDLSFENFKGINAFPEELGVCPAEVL